MAAGVVTDSRVTSFVGSGIVFAECRPHDCMYVLSSFVHTWFSHPVCPLTPTVLNFVSGVMKIDA